MHTIFVLLCFGRQPIQAVYLDSLSPEVVFGEYLRERRGWWKWVWMRWNVRSGQSGLDEWSRLSCSKVKIDRQRREMRAALITVCLKSTLKRTSFSQTSAPNSLLYWGVEVILPKYILFQVWGHLMFLICWIRLALAESYYQQNVTKTAYAVKRQKDEHTITCLDKSLFLLPHEENLKS